MMRRSRTLNHFHLPQFRFSCDDKNRNRVFKGSLPSSKSSLCVKCGLPTLPSPNNPITSRDANSHDLFERAKSRRIGERLTRTVNELETLIEYIDAQLCTDKNRSNVTPNYSDPLVEREKVERLCGELREQLAHSQHGYIPNSGPNLQDKMERLDALLVAFSGDAEELAATPSTGRAFSAQPQSPLARRAATAAAARIRSASAASEVRRIARTCIALFDFVPQNTRELAFRRGDILHIHRQIDANWLDGERNDGRVGVFPLSYVQVYDSQSGPKHYKVLYKFEPLNENELPLEPIEIVERIRDVDSHWLEGRNSQGQIGIFPRNYVIPIYQLDDKYYINDYDSPPLRPKTPKIFGNNSRMIDDYSNFVRYGKHSTTAFMVQSKSTHFHADPTENPSTQKIRTNPSFAIYNTSRSHSAPACRERELLGQSRRNHLTNPVNRQNFAKRMGCDQAWSHPDRRDSSSVIITDPIRSPTPAAAGTTTIIVKPNGSWTRQGQLMDPSNLRDSRDLGEKKNLKEFRDNSKDSLVTRILADPSLKSETQSHDLPSVRMRRGRSVGLENYFERAGNMDRRLQNSLATPLKFVPPRNCEKYRALYSYEPQHEDELSLQEEDLIYVVRKCDDGWFIGTQERTGQFGTFPGNYAVHVESSIS